MDIMAEIERMVKEDLSKSPERRNVLVMIQRHKDIFKKIEQYAVAMGAQHTARTTSVNELVTILKGIDIDTRHALYCGNYFTKKQIVTMLPRWELFVIKGVIVNSNGKYRKMGLQTLIVTAEGEIEDANKSEADESETYEIENNIGESEADE